MKMNELTCKLFADGYTEKDNPPGMRPYNAFYGGFQYDATTLSPLVFETPCGLLVQGHHFMSGMMSYMGIDWMPENNNPTICCPKFQQEACMLNHELLRNESICQEITSCACHLTDRAYDYAQSYDKAHDDVWREADALYDAFSVEKQGRVCRHQSNYDRLTKTWRLIYDPLQCARNGWCQYCSILQIDLSEQKGNVFYDVKTTWTQKGVGLFPDEVKSSILKGKKLLDKVASMTICEVLARDAQHNILDRETNCHQRQCIDNPTLRIEILNIRAERRDTRDLLLDLQDVAEGIEVIHAGDMLKAAAQKKHDRRISAKEKRIVRLEKKILLNGWKALEESDQYRAIKQLTWSRIREMEAQRKASKEAAEDNVQFSLY